MQYAGLVSLLALGAVALPGHYVPRSITPVQALEVPTATTSATSASTPAMSQLMAEATKLCDPMQMNRDNWNYFQMDYWLETLSYDFPMNMMNGEEVPSTADFVKYLAILTGNIGNFICEVNVDCNINVQNMADCETGNPIQPLIYFAINAMVNFYDWQAATRAALQTQWITFTGKADAMVQDFTDHDIDEDSTSSFLTIVGAVFSAVAPFVAENPALDFITGAVAGGIGVGTSILGATQQDAAQILQQEFTNIATLEDAIYNITNITDRAIESLAVGVLNTVPDNSNSENGAQWNSLASSAPQVLAGGAFAEPMTWDEYDTTASDFFSKIAVYAINQCWQMESVFIAKASVATGDVMPKDMILDALGSTSRVCDPAGGDLCYFFVVAQDTSHTDFRDDWLQAKGVDKTSNYGVDAWTFCQAAEWYQAKYGSYLMEPVDANDFLSDFQNSDDQPPGGLYVNLPVVVYDNAPQTTVNTFGESWGVEAMFLDNLSTYVGQLNGWPYDSHMGPADT